MSTPTKPAESTATTVKLPFKPKAPKFGGIKEVGTDLWAAWTGGKPRADLASLRVSTPGSIDPNQFRANSISAQAKSKVYRTQGLETKFTRDSDVLTFQKKVMKHLVSYGLDTITYLKDPTTSGSKVQVVSVIDHHAKFDVKDATKEANTLMTNGTWDAYDLDNIRDAKEFLLNSISEDLETQLYENCEDTDSFSAYWLQLIHIVKSVSIYRFDQVKNRIKSRSLDQYASENIESICTDYLSDWKELHGAGMYDQNLTMSMLDTIMDAGGSGKGGEDFRYPLRAVKAKLETKLLKTRHMDYVDQHLSMVQDELDVTNILKVAKDKYRTMLSEGQWAAAAHAKDSKAMNKNYGSVNMVTTLQEMERKINALVQSTNAGAPKGRRPGNSGWNKNKKFDPKKANSRDKSARNNPNRKKNHASQHPPPKSGESEIKTIGGVKRYWCAKCNRWTISHTTDGHKTKEELLAEKDPSASMARVSFDMHPSAFKIHGPDDSKYFKEKHTWPKWYEMIPIMLLMLITFCDPETMKFIMNVWTSVIGTVTSAALNKLNTFGPIVSTSCSVIGHVASNLFNSFLTELNNVSYLWIVMTVISGCVGICTGAYLYAQCPPELGTSSTRTRSGPNYRKKWLRATKTVKRSRRFKRNNPVQKEVVQGRQENYVHHPRFNNVGRNNRYEPPTVARIRIVKQRIRYLRTEIRRVEQYLHILRENLRNDEQLLDQLLRSGSKYRPRVHKPRLVKPKVNKPQRSVRNKPFDLGPCLAQCYKGNLVNIERLACNKVNKSNVEPVLFDSGANCCITNNRDDFSGKFRPINDNLHVDGIGKGLKIHGIGHVAWTFVAKNGTYRTLRLPCYYVPSANCRIASIQKILKEYPRETVTIGQDALELSGSEEVPGIRVPFSKQSRLPVAATVLEHDNPRAYAGRSNSREKNKLETIKRSHSQCSLVSPTNSNLSEPEKELLRWHYRLGHIGIKRVQWLFRQGVLGLSEKARRLQSTAAKLTTGPMCTACQYAKQRRKPQPGKTTTPIKREQHSLKRNELFPGSEVSIDHFICNPLGRLLHTYGKESNDAKYKGGCIFVDHATGYTHVELQTSLNSHHTLDAKKAFDEVCASMGVVPQKFLSDNGSSFTNASFESHLNEFKQTIRHSSVGGHHSNGIAERNISTVLSIARAMLHHQAIHWPDVANVELWPLAVLHAVHILNRIPREDTGRSPLELFSRKTWPSSKFHDLHVWGCPVYVLNSTLSDGHKLPRWKPRSDRRIYVGNSMAHGHAVPLVLNLDTGKISAQFHVVFDDWFHTVDNSTMDKIDFDHPDWYSTFGLTEWQYVSEGDESGELPPPVTELEGVSSTERLRIIRDQRTPGPESSLFQRESTDPPMLPVAPKVPKEEPHQVVPAPSSVQREKDNKPTPQSDKVGWFDVEVAPPQPSPPTRTSPPKSPPGFFDVETAAPPSTSTRSSSRRTGSERTSSDGPASRTRSSQASQDLEQPEVWATIFDKLCAGMGLFVGKAKGRNTDPDTYTWDEAMASPYKEEFLKAADVEIAALEDKGTWEEDLIENATTRIVPGQWVFRIKRDAMGNIKKFKARYCLRGDLQEDDGRDNFSPVAGWATIRSFLLLALILGWVTTTIDFSSAFVQSYLPEDMHIWMHLPRGYKSKSGPGRCLRLVKSLYGLRNAPQLWVNHSSEAFKKLGLKQSKYDPCLWFGDQIMLVQYVDDCGIAAPNQERIDQFVADLRKLDFELTQEESFEEFLGIKFETKKDGTVECTQQGLIKKTLEAAGMEDCNPNSVPALQKPLGTDEDGESMTESWNYRGICGMLLYLSTNTRPDIAYAVSQVCRFGHNPKKSHASAVKTILRYLKKTQDKGIIVRPDYNELTLNLWCDADFAGLFGQENPRNPESVKSRQGYIAILCGWPIVWKSQLQGHLSQSTLESEYSCLSTALRMFIPLKNLIKEIIAETKCPKLKDARVHASVFEDNQSTVYLVQNQRITSRTKYLLARWHWFWDMYNKGEFTIIKCATDEQKADYLTKAQPRATFEANRFAVQGW